jgi:hypothetical protein
MQNEIIRVAPFYSKEFLEIVQPKPLSDKRIENLYLDILNGKIKKDISDNVYKDFLDCAEKWIFNTKLNHFANIDTFNRKDIINGCTQFIDTIYMNGPVQTLIGDYRYHERLNLHKSVEVKKLIPQVPLIIAMPFPQSGSCHENMEEILNECLEKEIDVHIDGAWITCCKDITFDFNHLAIKSVGISLSKGLGLGWNRIGIRWTKSNKSDAITIMNDFRMNLRAPAIIGLHYLKEFPSDYLWNNYGQYYYKICNDFDLEPTKSIHLAKLNNNPVGTSPLLRYLIENEK